MNNKRLKQIARLFVFLGELNSFRKVNGVSGYGNYYGSSRNILFVSVGLIISGVLLFIFLKKEKKDSVTSPSPT